jgi:hypothetical protein
MAIMNAPRSVEASLITDVGTSFHNACNKFFDVVDINKTLSLTNVSSDEIFPIISNYFISILNGSPEEKELLHRFAMFQADRFIAFINNPARWFPCNRELEVVRPSRGFWGTIDSVEFISDKGEDRAVIEFKCYDSETQVLTRI